MLFCFICFQREIFTIYIQGVKACGTESAARVCVSSDNPPVSHTCGGSFPTWCSRLWGLVSCLSDSMGRVLSQPPRGLHRACQQLTVFRCPAGTTHRGLQVRLSMETMGKEVSKLEHKEPDDSQDGIHRRLRDRELLKKRKAEAEEKATYQWVYGVQSKRQRVQREKSSSGKVGRPRKVNPKAQLPDTQKESLPEDSNVEEVLSPEATPVGVEIPMPLLPSLAPVLTQPLPEAVPILSLADDLGIETKSNRPPGDILIEDLGPDESEDIPPVPENLPTDRGTIEELSDSLTANNQMFSVPATSLLPQEDNLSRSLL
ncbi:hemogen isoform X1 [Arapaima gigas]